MDLFRLPICCLMTLFSQEATGKKQTIQYVQPLALPPKDLSVQRTGKQSDSSSPSHIQNFACLDWLFPKECEALLRFYKSKPAASFGSEITSSWFTSKNVCTWEGITCSPKFESCEPSLVVRKLPAACEWVKFLPDFYPPNRVFRLRLRKNQLFDLPTQVFSAFPHLLFLDLGNNHIRSLSDQVFLGLSSLRELALWGNEIEVLPTSVFQGLSTVKKLMLFQNRLKALPEQVFASLPQVEEISLAQNQIKQLPGLLFASNKKLQKLHLQENQIKVLSESLFQNTPALEELVMYQNRIQKLSPEIFSSLGSLQKLFLQKNQLRHVPKHLLEKVVSLKEISFAENQLQDLPIDIFDNLPALEVINLQKNPNLKWKIPKALCDKPGLEILVEQTQVVPCEKL